MHPGIQKLYDIAKKPRRLIIGLMSGTSLDGLDIALCSFEGSGLQTSVKLLQHQTILYEEDLKEEIRTVFAQKQIDLEKLCILHPYLALKHAEMVLNTLDKWGIKSEDVDLLASHGQTVYHAPFSLHQQVKFGNATMQIGDGDHLSVATGIITLSDFRQKHIAGGGEGAPLSLYGDYLLYGTKGIHNILLNIGGIANFTYLPASMIWEEVISTDTGPGNTLMDAYTRQNFPGMLYDKDAAIASKGKVHESLLTQLNKNAFFNLSFPRTTGPELFNLEYVQHALERSDVIDISKEDVMATLNRFTVDSIINAIRKIHTKNVKAVVTITGGGAHNPLLVSSLKKELKEYSFLPKEEQLINPDAKEAVLFALLANEAVGGNDKPLNNLNNQQPQISMGKISFPY